VFNFHSFIEFLELAIILWNKIIKLHHKLLDLFVALRLFVNDSFENEIESLT
jgi:hypothetical protein